MSTYKIKKEQLENFHMQLDDDRNMEVSQTEFEKNKDEAIEDVFTSSPDDPFANNSVSEMIADFQNNLTYNRFQTWNQFFATSSSDELTVNSNGIPEFETDYIFNEKQKEHEFHGTTAPAEIADIQAGSLATPIYSNNNVSHNHTQNSTDEIYATISDIDPQVLDLIHSVTLNPVQNPEDAYWAKEYNNPNFYSYMTAGHGGDITVYPTTFAIPQPYELFAIQHEIGHVWSLGKWGYNTKHATWRSWNDAIGSDSQSPRSYSDNSPSEDFADFFGLYFYLRNHDNDHEGLLASLPKLKHILDQYPEATRFEALSYAFPSRFHLMSEIANELGETWYPGSTTWRDIQDHYKQAEQSQNDGDWIQAAQHYQSVLKIDSEQTHAKEALIEVRLKIANQAYQEKNYATAIIYYEMVYKTEPEIDGLKSRLVTTYMLHGFSLYEKGQFHYAKLCYERASNLDPDNALATENLAIMNNLISQGV